MEITCCVCGKEMDVIDAIQAEEERKSIELEEGIPIPVIGIVCETCRSIYR